MANTFVWQNDPDSGIDFSSVSRTDPYVSDSITYSGIKVESTDGDPLTDVAIFVPYVWVAVEDPVSTPRHPGTVDHYVRLDWDNALGGFYTSDFDNTGEALLVTVEIVTKPDTPDGLVAAGSVADITGKHAFGPTSTSSEIKISASEGSIPARLPETLEAGDMLPIAYLDSRQTKETFSVVFTYDWLGEEDYGAYRTSFFVASLTSDIALV